MNLKEELGVNHKSESLSLYSLGGIFTWVKGNSMYEILPKKLNI